MKCREGCAACCIAPSISSPLPLMPRGKPAGVPCPHLTAELKCGLWNRPERPRVCGGLAPSPEMCGGCREDALTILSEMERATAPDAA
jgi:Fe-S-cluster containining protein